MRNGNTPIKRKICKIGTGFAIFLPKSWLELIEEKHGTVEAVTIEVDNVLTVAPILKGGTRRDYRKKKEGQIAYG
jgi:antitoxin component of MazEF toxin-antitoxin module